MKILFYLEPPSVYRTLLSWTLAEELRLRGHVVHYGKEPLLNQYDWIYSAGVNSWDAVDLARKIGAKVHIHLEGVAYWRIGFEPATDWGYSKNLTPEEVEEWCKHYTTWMSAAYEADSCSVNGKNQVKVIEDELFDGKPLPNCHLISCGADARFALTLPDWWGKKNYMVTVSRLEPNKKVFMIAEALVLLKKKGVDVPPWIVLGYGSQMNKLMEICKQGDVKLGISSCFGAEKWRIIKMAILMLQGWSGVPPAEGLLCEVPVLSFNHPDIVELYDDAIFWAEDNNVGEYANQIHTIGWGTAPTDITKKVADGRHKLLEGELYACTQEQADEIHETVFI